MKKRKIHIALIVFVTALSIGTLGIAQQSPTDAPVNLELKLKEGDQFTQKINLQVSNTEFFGGMNIKMEGLVTLAVSNISDDGIINLIGTTYIEPIEVQRELRGDSAEIFAVITQQLRRDGSVISHLIDFALDQELSMTLGSLPSGLPSKPVKIGDSWTRTVKDEKVGNLKTTYTLAGFEKQKGYDCAKITGVIDIYISGLEGNEFAIGRGEYLAYFAVEEGLMVVQRVVTESQVTMPTGEQDSSITDLKMELINKKRLTTVELQKTISSLEILKIGMNHLNKREYNQAKAEFQKFLSTYPDSPLHPDVEKLIAKAKEPIHPEQLRQLRQEGKLDELLASAVCDNIKLIHLITKAIIEK